MKEYPEERIVRADLCETFGRDAIFITLKELAAHEGRDYRTIRKRYGIPAGAFGIDRAILAHRMCELAHK